MGLPIALFRCDGGSQIGLGHISRCLALADALANEHWECRFAVSSETASLGILTQTSFDIFTLDEPMAGGSLFGKDNPSSDFLVIDHYGLDHAYEREVHQHVGLLLVIDDAPGRMHHCDLLLDAGYDRQPEDYAGYVPSGCEFMCGPEFVLLGSPYAAKREKVLVSRQQRSQVSRILVCFGGVDSRGFSMMGLEALNVISKPLTIDVVISSHSKHLDKLEKLALTSPHEVLMHIDCREVDVLLANADIALGASGINAWERCAFGLPSIVVCAAENQRPLYNAITRLGAAIGIDEQSADVILQISNRVQELTNNSSLRQQISHRAAAVCDGQGAKRSAGIINHHRKQHVTRH